MKNKIAAFYADSETSREWPHKKDVTGEGNEKRVMVMTTQEAYNIFKQTNADVKVGLTTFRKLKPKNILQVSETSHHSCLCQSCCNIAS